MTIRECTREDIPQLAALCIQLDEAVEGRSAPQPVEEERFEKMMDTHRAFFFVQDSVVLGYALCDMRQHPVYIRQFFVQAGSRRQGAGKQAFALLRQALGAKTLSLDCHLSNEAALRFWHGLGFVDKHVRIVLEEDV